MAKGELERSTFEVDRMRAVECAQRAKGWDCMVVDVVAVAGMEQACPAEVGEGKGWETFRWCSSREILGMGLGWFRRACRCVSRLSSRPWYGVTQYVEAGGRVAGKGQAPPC